MTTITITITNTTFDTFISSININLIDYIISCYITVDFRSFIVFFLGRDPGTLKSDIVSKKHPQLICPDLRLSN